MTTLKDFKRSKRLTTTDVAEMFGITHREVYYYSSIGAVVKGKVGERYIEHTLIKNKVVGRENAPI
jgi:hypothetical protein